MTIKSQLDQVLALKELARDIHYAIIDDGLAPIDPPGNSAMREAIERVLTPDRLSAIRATVGGEAVAVVEQTAPEGLYARFIGAGRIYTVTPGAILYASPPATVDVGAMRELVEKWRGRILTVVSDDSDVAIEQCADELAALIDGAGNG